MTTRTSRALSPAEKDSYQQNLEVEATAASFTADRDMAKAIEAQELQSKTERTPGLRPSATSSAVDAGALYGDLALALRLAKNEEEDRTALEDKANELAEEFARQVVQPKASRRTPSTSHRSIAAAAAQAEKSKAHQILGSTCRLLDRSPAGTLSPQSRGGGHRARRARLLASLQETSQGETPPSRT